MALLWFAKNKILKRNPEDTCFFGGRLITSFFFSFKTNIFSNNDQFFFLIKVFVLAARDYK